MPYIGSSASPLPVNFAAVQAQSFNGTGSQTAFTLSRTVPSAASIEVLVNNVQQSPYDASYSVSGTTLTFSEAPSSGTNNVYVVYRDQSLGSLVDESAYRRAEAVAKAGDTMTGALALPAGGLNVGSGQLAVDASGRVTMPYQPAFHAYRSTSGSDTLQSASSLVFNQVIANRGNHYNAQTGVFTAPVAGMYYFSTGGHNNSVLGYVTIQLYAAGSIISNAWNAKNDGSGHADSLFVSGVRFMNANDTAYVTFVTTKSSNYMIETYWHFNGYLIG